MNALAHVQSRKLVHVSGIHCHVCASSTSGCAFVYFTVQYCIEYSSIVSFFKIYFWAALGLHCCARAFSSCREWGLLFVVMRGLLITVASLVAELGL